MEKENSFLKHLIWGIIGFFLLVGVDQWTKYLAIRNLKGLKGNGITLIPGALSLQYLENRGAAFGILQNRQWIFIVLSVLFLLLAAYLYCQLPLSRRYRLLNIITVVMAAGACGNLIDRLRFSYVVDFIYFNLIDFPVFNLADCFVTISAVIMFLSVVFYYRDDDFQFFKKEKDEG